MAKMNRGSRPLAVSKLQLISSEQIAAIFTAGGWEDRTVDPDDDFKFRLQFADDIAFYVGLGPSVQATSVRFSPNVGVQHAATSRLVAEFLGLQSSVGDSLCSIGMALADILNRNGISVASFQRWRIASFGELRPVLEAIYSDVVEYGISEFSEIRSLDGFIERLQAQSRHQTLSGHLAVACGIADRRTQAESALREYFDSSRGQRGFVLQQTRAFVSKFTEYFGFGSECLA